MIIDIICLSSESFSSFFSFSSKLYLFIFLHLSSSLSSRSSFFVPILVLYHCLLFPILLTFLPSFLFVLLLSDFFLFSLQFFIFLTFAYPHLLRSCSSSCRHYFFSKFLPISFSSKTLDLTEKAQIVSRFLYRMEYNTVPTLYKTKSAY